MNTMDYSFLVKDMGLHKKIEGMQKAKNILFWLIFPLCFVPMLSNLFDNNTVIKILSSIVLIFLIAELVFNIYFYKFIDKSRNAQILSPNDETDKVFIELNGAYSIHFAFVRKLICRAITIAIVGFLAFLGCLIAGAIIESEILFIIGTLIFVVFLAVIIVSTLIIIFKQMSFARKSMDKMERIRQYFFVQEGLTPEQIAKKKRNIFTNVADNQKILAYMYPDEDIRNKVQKKVFVLMIPTLIIGGVAGGVGAMAAMNENLTLLCIALAVGGAGIIGAIAAYVVGLNRLIKKQRAIFEADSEKYRYHLELADQTKNYQKKSNLLTLIITAVIFLAGTVLWFIIPKTVIEMGGLIFLCLIVWAIAIMAFFIPSYKSYRAKAKPIEQKIEEHNKQNEIIIQDNQLK